MPKALVSSKPGELRRPSRFLRVLSRVEALTCFLTLPARSSSGRTSESSEEVIVIFPFSILNFSPG